MRALASASSFLMAAAAPTAPWSANSAAVGRPGQQGGTMPPVNRRTGARVLLSSSPNWDWHKHSLQAFFCAWEGHRKLQRLAGGAAGAAGTAGAAAAGGGGGVTVGMPGVIWARAWARKPASAASPAPYLCHVFMALFPRFGMGMVRPASLWGRPIGSSRRSVQPACPFDPESLWWIIRLLARRALKLYGLYRTKQGCAI